MEGIDFAVSIWESFRMTRHDPLCGQHTITKYKGAPKLWKWFGEELTYANARMPQAMLLAADVAGNERFLKIGIDSLEFLLAQSCCFLFERVDGKSYLYFFSQPSSP
jgi:hypothetical protein